MPDAPFDESVANRWFAIQLNNLAWDLLEKRDLSAVDREKLIHMSHASCYHWMQVGNIVNHARALCLIANAEAAYGDPDSAMKYSQSCLDAVYAESMYRDAAHPEDWDIAFAHDARARACGSAWRLLVADGQMHSDAATALFEEANQHRSQANQLGQAIAAQEDREAFLQWFASGDWHGLV